LNLNLRRVMPRDPASCFVKDLNAGLSDAEQTVLLGSAGVNQSFGSRDVTWAGPRSWFLPHHFPGLGAEVQGGNLARRRVVISRRRNIGLAVHLRQLFLAR